VNLLYVGTLPPHPGGSAITCGQLVVSFARLGHRVRALAPITPAAYGAGDWFAMRHPETEVFRFIIPHFDTDPRYPIQPAYRRQQERQLCEHVDRLMDRERPDVVLLGREGFAWHVPRLAARRAVPCALRISGSLLWALAEGTYPPALAAHYLAGIRSLDVVVVQAEHMREIAERLGCPNVVLIPNAVDLALFMPKPVPAPLRRALGIAPDDVVVVHASNLKPVKRPLDIVGAAALALSEDPRLVFVIVGDGPVRSAMEEACRTLDVSARFRFVGWIEYERMPDYLALADIVVMTSEFEQQARVYLETQAAGRLLLASAVRSAREVIDDGRTGLLFRPGDLGDLAAKLLRAAADPAFRAGLGEEARVRVARHSLDRIAPRFAATLDGLVRRHRDSSAVRRTRLAG
jgi:glycosyltransferase involved in cell wall biosynthesis